QASAQPQHPQSAQTAPSPAPATPPPSEEIIGSPSAAKYKITVGWVYDATTQANWAALTQTLDVARKFAMAHRGKVSLVIADLDVPPEERSPAARTVTEQGFTLNGKPLADLTDNPGEGNTPREQITYILVETAR
ncbi:MAG: hypothetical protein JO250_10655, partial [Armatimonadetes bacterium]|nr:hypothetical protein [Armatimonadota bacterium]